MTTLDPTSAQAYRVYVSAHDEWVTARPLLSAAGVKPLAQPDPDLQTRLEKARDRVQLSQASQQAADAADATAAPQPQVTPASATLSFDIDALKATALTRLQQAEAQIARDTEAWVPQFRALLENVGAAAKRLIEAADKIPRYAIIRDEKGNQVGYVDQTGGVAISDARYFGLLAALKGQDGKSDRYDALRKALGRTGSIELTGVDVDLNVVLAGQFRDVKAARDALDAFTASRRAGQTQGLIA